MNSENEKTGSSLPARGRVCGIDFGTVRIGIAISDPGQQFSSPLEVYSRRSRQQDETYFRDLTKLESLVGFVVGLPIHTSGDESEKSRQARNFAVWLGSVTDCPVVMFDERFTTAQAREYLNQSRLSGRKRKERLDKIAAQILLAAYLESPAQALSPARIKEAPLEDLDESAN